MWGRTFSHKSSESRGFWQKHNIFRNLRMKVVELRSWVRISVSHKLLFCFSSLWTSAFLSLGLSHFCNVLATKHSFTFLLLPLSLHDSMTNLCKVNKWTQFCSIPEKGHRVPKENLASWNPNGKNLYNLLKLLLRLCFRLTGLTLRTSLSLWACWWSWSTSSGWGRRTTSTTPSGASNPSPSTSGSKDSSEPIFWTTRG